MNKCKSVFNFLFPLLKLCVCVVLMLRLKEVRGAKLQEELNHAKSTSKISITSLYVTVWATAMTAAQKVAAKDRTSDLQIWKQTSWPLGHPAPQGSKSEISLNTNHCPSSSYKVCGDITISRVSIDWLMKYDWYVPLISLDIINSNTTYLAYKVDHTWN